MKKLAIVTALVASSIFATSVFAESDNLTLTITGGLVDDSTCIAKFDKSIVTLGSVDKSTLQKEQFTNADGSLQLDVTDCPAIAKQALITFSGTTGTNENYFDIRKNKGDASGILLRIDTESAIVRPNMGFAVPLTNGAVSIPFSFSYLATSAPDQIQAGIVQTTLDVNVAYR